MGVAPHMGEATDAGDPTRGKLNQGFGLYHRAAMIMETLTMFYNREEKEVGMEHTHD